eukprot:TRINITY_DN65487_c0_g1_i1.p1 TRINITY_DN65487_c0_g1~~TRINITY_DN65487_c0_g1_i1.p1  ORF type:complete len:657 (+),score=104.31 TRINITY_DN65487_c0_g1_i1:98-1972(+)
MPALAADPANSPQAGSDSGCGADASRAQLAWDLYRIRRQLVELARAHRIGLVSIFLHWIVITQAELQQLWQRCGPSALGFADVASSADPQDDKDDRLGQSLRSAAAQSNKSAISGPLSGSSRAIMDSMRAGLVPWWPQPPQTRPPEEEVLGCEGGVDASVSGLENGRTAVSRLSGTRRRPRRALTAERAPAGGPPGVLRSLMAPGCASPASAASRFREQSHLLEEHPSPMPPQHGVHGGEKGLMAPGPLTPAWGKASLGVATEPAETSPAFGSSVERQPTDAAAVSIGSSIVSQGEALCAPSNYVRSIIDDARFGVELEVLSVRDHCELFMSVKEKAQNSLVPFLLEKGIKGIHFEDYDSAKADEEYRSWKVTTDASIQAEDGRSTFGFELVSPICSGWRGIAECKVVAHCLRAFGCGTNNTTATHVHVGCRDLSDDQLRRFAQMYCVFEAVIDDFHAFPRRKDYSRYCRSIVRSIDPGRNVDGCVAAIAATGDCSELCELVNPMLTRVKDSGRNHKVNFQHVAGTCLDDPGRRIEWRQHAGTCDGEEIGMWIRFTCLFTYRAANYRPVPTASMGTEQQLWQLLDDDVLRTFYSRKKSTLPECPPRFFFASRELYQGCEDQWLL